MALLDNYSDALDDIKKYLQQDLIELEITSAQIFGSATHEKGFIKGISDIDICVYTNKLNTISPEEIIEIICKSRCDFKDKRPTFINDHTVKRIEFFVKHPMVVFDITILAPEFPNRKNIEETAPHDSLELFTGALYQHGVPLFGEIPDKIMVEEKFYPFYSDNLRLKRLNILTDRIENYTNQVEILQNSKNPDLIDHLYKARSYFLKWLFIYLRKYPISLNKHIGYQLSDILVLPWDEQEALLFLGDGDLYKLSSKFLQVSKKYLSKYRLEHTWN